MSPVFIVVINSSRYQNLGTKIRFTTATIVAYTILLPIHPISHGARVVLPDPYLDRPRLFTE